MSSIVVRPLAEDDDPDALTQGNPLAWSLLQWHAASRRSDLPLSWFAAELEGTPVGIAVVMRAANGIGDSAPCLLSVRPEARRRGVGAALRRAVEAEVGDTVPHATGVTYPCDLRSPDSAAAVAAWGLPVVARHQESVLDLGRLAPETASRSQVAGVEIRPLPRFGRLDDTDWAVLHAFVQDRIRESPDAEEGGGELPFEAFRAIVAEPWMLLEARAADERIGVTFVVRRPPGARAMNTFFTGVEASHRRRGVATALKSAHALLLAQRGIESVFTQNLAGNEPIMAANRTLGFAPAGEYVEVRARLP